jgi:hypothetical protein
MKPTILGVAASAIGWFALVAVAETAKAQVLSTQANYATMAPLEQYLIPDRDTEAALARSAAPDSISRDAEVLILSRHGYENVNNADATATKGKNGFVCMVLRGWSAAADFPEFWNAKIRAPICLNAPAARSYLPLILKKTEWVLAGRTAEQIGIAIDAAITRKELPTPEPGAMCYMMSKQAYLADDDPHWHPHVMFFMPYTEAAAWGANLPGSPVIAAPAKSEHLTIFLIPVRRWSDGAMDSH